MFYWIRFDAYNLVLLLVPFIFINSSFAQHIEDLKKGVVKIEATTFEEKRKVGTGFIVRLEEDAMYIVTASHVVEGASEIKVAFFPQEHQTIPAELIGIQGGDPKGLAALLVRENIPSDLSALNLTSSVYVQGGEPVTTIGFPQISEVPWAVIQGNIIGRGRDGKTLAFSGAVDEGNSGGPLMKDKQVIGIVTETDGQFAYAVPTVIAQYVLEGWGIPPPSTPDPTPSPGIPTPPPTATPTPLPTVSEAEQKIVQLLEKADVYFERQWYTTPEETNAFDVYLEVLKIDPDNEHALQQIQRMLEFYKSRAEQADKQGKMQKALLYYQRYLKIAPDDEIILKKVVELEDQLSPELEIPTPLPTATPIPLSTVTPTLPTAIPTPLLAPVAGQEWYDPVSDIDFVWVPEGCFQMGQTEAGKRYLVHVVGEERYMGYTHELPRHKVCLDGFWMGKYEITQTQWQQVMGENPSYFNKDRVGQDTSSHPVEQVPGYDVQEFLRRLNKQTGEEMYRLPTEAEWEYAARAGTETIFYFGNEVRKLGEYAWYWDTTNRTHPVGRRKPPNAWGLYNMYGNVSELCADPWHDNYEGAPTDGSVWKAGGNTSFRVLRGGSWTTTPWLSRIAMRFKISLESRNNGAGFRVVVDSAEWTHLSTATSIPSPTPTTPTCGGVKVGGYCWYYGTAGESCDDVCAPHGGYHEATRTYAGSDGSVSNCNSVMDALGVPGTGIRTLGDLGVGCHYDLYEVYPEGIRTWSHEPTTSNASQGYWERRVCACNE